MANPVNPELKKVMAVIESYIEGTYRADTDLLKNIFHKDAKMTGYLGGRLLVGTPEPFFEDLKAHPPMSDNKDPYQVDIRAINLAARIASVVIFESGFFGEGRIETHFHLIKGEDSGHWKIVSKLFTTV